MIQTINEQPLESAKHLKRGSATATMFVIALFALPQVVLAGEDDSPTVDWGRELYMDFCVSCHGWTGKGDGPAGPSFKITPADLTQLSARNGGEFPRAKIKKYIDGEEDIQAHGSRKMRVWGKALRREVSSANEARMQIHALAEFLESIQAKPES
jgi:mono/diheme cytochrome c family protein